jgi:hypothetical protein
MVITLKPSTRFHILWISIFLFLNAFLSDSSLKAQSQKTWQWVKQMGGDSWDISAGVVCDSKDNLFVTGSFMDTLLCGSKEVMSSGNQDIFVAIFNEKGVIEEIFAGGGRGKDIATCIGINQDDIVVIGGMLSDSARFNKTQAPGNGKRLFVAATNDKGKFIWINTISIKGDASLYLIDTDILGNIFVSGVFTGKLKSDELEITSKGKKDIFLARINKKGVIEKIISLGGLGDDSPSSLSVNASGKVVLAGTFEKAFETGGIKLFAGTESVKTKVFLLSLNSDFSAIWSRVFLGDDYAQISSLEHDNSGNLYASGSFTSKLHTLDTTLTSKGYTDGFILKYLPDGKLDWGRCFGTWYYDYASHLNVNNLDGVIITGSVGDTLEIDSLRVNPLTNSNAALLLQFSSSGKAIWADCISGEGKNFSDGSTIDQKGNLYMTGTFRNNFDKGETSLTSYGDQDIFLAKYFNCQTSQAEIFGELSICPGKSTELSVSKGHKNILWNDTIPNKSKLIVTKPGQYWVNMRDKKGCLLVDTVQVEQNNLPVFTLGNDTTILISDSILLSAPSGYPKYEWQDYSIEQTYLAKSNEGKKSTEDYWSTITDSLSCSYTDTISITYIDCYNWLDLDDIKIVLYPNPVLDKVFWYLNTDETCQVIIDLTDDNGRILYHLYYKNYYPNELEEINLTNIPSGVYNIRITNSPQGGKFKTVTVIKK